MNILLLLGVVNVVGIAAERLNLEFEKNLGSWKILLVKGSYHSATSAGVLNPVSEIFQKVFFLGFIVRYNKK